MSTSHTNPLSIRSAAATWSVVSAAGAVVLMAFAQLTQPEVVPHWQPPSELALGRTGWAMTSGFLLLGASSLLLFLALRGQAATRTGRVGRYALVVASVGGIVAGVFPTDRWDAAELSTTGMLHSLAPLLLDGIPVASVILGISLTRRSEGWRSQRGWLLAGSFLLVGAAVALTVGLATLVPADGTLGPDVPLGWPARILLLSEAAWLAVAAGCALRVHRAADATTTGTARTQSVAARVPAGVA